MPGQTQIPLYSEIFVKCREIPLLSRGADSLKSGKAIGEIAFGNAGKNSIANSSAAPTDFISHRRANFSAYLGDFPVEKSLRDILFFKIMRYVTLSFAGRMLLPPRKPHM